MLSRRFPQPARKFEPVIARPADAKAICDRCVDDVFNPSLGRSLVAARDAVLLAQPCSWLARDVYTSMLNGCRWCATIGNAILTSVDWDDWLSDQIGSISDDDSLYVDGDSDEDEDSDGNGDSDEDGDLKDADECARPEPAIYRDEEISRGSDGDGANDFNEEDVAEDSSSGGPGSFIKALDCAATLDVTIEFLKWGDSPVFNLVKVTIEVTPSDQEDCDLQKMVGDNAVAMTLEVISANMINQVFPRRWDIVSAASNEWAPRAEAWLRACGGHRSCAPSGIFQPTRLIDVRDSKHPRLVTRESKCDVQPYAVLSYVWGLKQSYVLTNASIAEMHAGLDLSRLPRTISDAIEVARRLGFDYIWVDALCIIQDSPEDKAKELPLMADVYRESSISIVAASAASANEGFLNTPEPARFLLDPFEVDLGTVDGSPLALTFGHRIPYKASGDPISSRAWTLQERVLSPRLLIFSRSGVMWMCRECYVNPSTAPDAGPPYRTSLHSSSGYGNNVDDDDGDDGDELAEAFIRKRWMAIRADYTDMDLTYCSDKLTAISALAAEVSRRTGWTYLAGMWRENLFSELHWQSSKRTLSGEVSLLKPQRAREAGYLAPSWSWASVGLGMIVDSEDESANREVFYFKILRCHIDIANDTDFQFGPVKSGYLEVEGKAVELAWELEDMTDFSEVLLLDTEDEGIIAGEGTLDPLDENLDPDAKFVCLGISRLRLGPNRIMPVEGLMLLPIGHGSGRFRRVGFFRMTEFSVFDDVATRILRIE